MTGQAAAAKPASDNAPAALANVGGTLLPLAEARVPAQDRGFLFGDAVYEVLRVYDGRPWLADEHFARLGRSLAAVRIAGVDLKRLRQRMDATIAAGPFGEAIVYIQITRGCAPRSHAFPANVEPLEFLYVQAFNDPYAEAREKGTSVILHPDIRWGRCDIKSTNLLANVLALQAAKEAGCSEALLYLPDGSLTEASHSSLFGVRGGQLITAPNGNSILPGVTRDLVVALARKDGITVLERTLQRDELSMVDEIFLSGTTTEVLPVTRIDGHSVGNGAPGPVTKRLRMLYNREANIGPRAT